MLYLLALEVMIASESRLGESPSVISQWQDELSQAKSTFETTFWDPQNNWYKYTEYASGSAVLFDTFYAQHVAEQFGLPDLVNLSHYRALGSPITPTQEHMIWTGANFFVGATCINAGKRFRSQALQANGIQMASAVASQVWGTRQRPRIRRTRKLEHRRRGRQYPLSRVRTPHRSLGYVQRPGPVLPPSVQ
jgi:non-lysosomal glucosylceramidase